MSRVQLFFPVDDPADYANVLCGDEVVASVFEKPDGCKIDLYQSPRGLDLAGIIAAVASARERLGGDPNRRGDDPPEGLSAAGLSLWLTKKADGTTLVDRDGQRPDAEPSTAPDRRGM